jgi:IMP dehydrogenase
MTVIDPKIRPEYDSSISYSDVFIIPNYSDVSSRKELDISSKLGQIEIPVPVISANMESVTDGNMCLALKKAGAIGALHRFMSISDNVNEFRKTQLSENERFARLPSLVSVGVNRDSHERAKALYDAGARYFVIDIAHGHSLHMKQMIQYLKNTFNVYVVAGNIATPEGARDLALWGADAVKINIAQGSVCQTKNVTGVTVPNLESVLKGVEGLRQARLMSEHVANRNVSIVADGGFVEIGDICKSLGAGADFIMTGRLLAACNEAPQGRTYRGSASKDVQETYRNDKQMPTPEGKSEILEPTGPVSKVIEDIAGGIRSSFSYVGARNLREFHDKCRFGVRFNK